MGFFVILGFAGLLFLALRVGNVCRPTSAETYRLTAKFDNIGGLKVRGPVKSAGVVVGRVSEIRLDPGSYEAQVTLTIDSRYRFPKDTFASILTAGLLGEQRNRSASTPAATRECSRMAKSWPRLNRLWCWKN